ncbi:WD40 repeat [Trypanosoma melophagium]|uniref:WD40 repeat n=1 Tax=Trypanosoma melophagium TaxID=715481 RepID=UPI003519E403|nr:WD40 repeat [Trypanosoma melophagium]
MLFNVDPTENLKPQGKVFPVSSPVVALTITPERVWLATSDGGVEIRDIYTAELVHRFASAPRPTCVTRIWSILSVMTQNKGLQVWMGLSNGSIEVYDAQSFRLVQRLAKHAGGVYCLAEFGGYVYSGSSDFKVAQWYAEDGRLVRMLHGHTNYVRCLYAEGSAVVSGSDDCTVRVWDVGSGEQQLTGHFHGRAGVSALCRVGVTMWSGDDDGRVIAWKLGTCEALRVLQAHGGRVASLRKIGSRVYSGGADGVIAVFDAEDGRLVQQIKDHCGGRIATVQCAWECSRYSVWTGASDNSVRCWHHDEFRPMTQDRERFNDMRWYFATVQSHHEANEKLLKQQRELAELVTLTQGGDRAVRNMLNMSEEMKNSTLLNCWVLQEQKRKTEKATRELQDERFRIQLEIQKQEQNITAVRTALQKTLEAVQRIRMGGVGSQTTGSSNVESNPALPTQQQQTVTSGGVAPVIANDISTSMHVLPASIVPPQPPTASVPPPPASTVPQPPTASVPPPPASTVPQPPTASVPPPPASTVPQPPTASVPPPPASTVPQPPTASVPPPPASTVPQPPTASVPPPPASTVPQPPTASVPPPPASTVPQPPTASVPPPPASTVPQPPTASVPPPPASTVPQPPTASVPPPPASTVPQPPTASVPPPPAQQ